MSGANLATWNDKSSNNYVCTPVSGNITQSTLNGLNVFYFNNLRALISNFVWTNDSTIFLVSRAPNSAFLYSQWTTTYTHYVFPANNALFYVGSSAQYRDSVNAFGNPVQISNAWGIFVIGYDSTARVPTNYAINGLARSAVLDAGPAPGAGSATAALYLNGNGVGPGTSGSFVAEILHYSRSISAAERQQIEGYLARKWGLQSLLPQLSYSNLPLNIPGCALWLDAADSSTVTLSGSNVTQWNDKSGSNHHAIQAVLAKRPVYSNASVNGLSTVQTSAAAASGMYIPSFTVTYPLTTFVVSQKTGTGGGNAMFIEQSADAGAASAGFYIFSGNADFYYLKRAGSAISVFGSNWTFNAVGTTYLYVAQISPNLIRVSANNIITGNTANTGSPVGSVTDQLNIGSRGQTTNLVGDVRYCEIIIYNGNLTADQYYRIERYLALKWGVGTTTPHPYGSILPVTRPFQPVDIAGCALWLDAADPSTVTLSGSNVTQWNDKSGNGYNATQATSGNRPVYVSESNRLSFTSASSQFLNLPTNALPAGNSSYAYFIVCSITSQTGRTLIAGGTFGTTNATFGFRSDNSGGGLRHYWWANDQTTAANAYTVNQTFIAEATYTSGGTRATLVNGTQLASDTPGTRSQATSPNYIGAGSNASLEFLDGTISEIVVFNAALTTFQRQQIEGYLARKWGLQGSSTLLTTFIPTQISSCALWLDAADSASMTFSGANITQWNDKSGNGRNTSNVVGTPVLSNNAVTSNRGVYFNGSSYFTGPFSYSSNTLTWFIAASMESGTGNTGRMLSFGIPGTFDFDNVTKLNAASREGLTNEIVSYRNAFIARNAFITYGSPFLFSGGIDGTSNFPFLNGTSVTGGATSGNFGFTQYAIANTAGTNLQALVGHIFEVLVYSNSLTTTQRQQIEGYLTRKWGIAGSLPATHPFVLVSIPPSHPFRSRLPMTTSFHPRQIADCALWLDAADPTTLILSGSNVTQWSDKSGTANHAIRSQRFSWLGPTVTSSNTLRFTRVPTVSVEMLRTQTGRQTTRPVTFAVVLKPIETNLGSMFDFQKTTNGQAFHSIFPNQMNVRGSSGATITAYAFTQLPSSSLSIVFFQSTANVFNGYINGSAFVTATATLSMPIADAVYTTIGAMTDLNYDGGGFATAATQIANSCSCEYAEVIMFNALLTTAQRQQVEGYLAWKWGLQGYSSYLSTSNTITSPTQISGCALWLDAADSSTFTLSGSNVTQWNDKSGNARNASGGVSPTFSNNAVVFNGSTQYLTTTYTAVPSAETVFVVATITGSTAPRNYFMFGTATANGRGYQVNITSGVYTVNWDRSTVARYAASGGIAQNVQFLTSGLFTGTGGSTGVNGGSQSTTASFSFAGTSTTAIGGAGNTAGTFWQGSINEIVIYNTVLTTDQRQQIEGYLALKWGLQNNLPRTHPYANQGLSPTHPYKKISPI